MVYDKNTTENNTDTRKDEMNMIENIRMETGNRTGDYDFLPTHVEIESATGMHSTDLRSYHAESGRIFLEGTINNETALRFASIMKYMADEQKDVEIYLNTPGGEINAGMMIYDIIRAYSRPLSIYCMGLAASMGALILAGGQKGRRYILPHSKVMVHEPLIANGFGGSATSIERTAQELLDTKKAINTLLAEHTGKSVKEIDRLTAYDNFMTAQEAVKVGICDEIKNIL